MAWTLTLATASPASNLELFASTKINNGYFTCPSDTLAAVNPRSFASADLSQAPLMEDKLSSMDHAEVHYFNRQALRHKD